jgi:hypothetical protein
MQQEVELGAKHGHVDVMLRVVMGGSLEQNCWLLEATVRSGAQIHLCLPIVDTLLLVRLMARTAGTQVCV